MDLNKLARNIVHRNIYLTLSTTDGKSPWIAPLYYVTDSNYTFYFFSNRNSKHAKHIRKNSNVAIAIYDSNQAGGEGNGIQMKAKAYEVPLKELPKVLTLYGKKYYTDTKPKFSLLLTLKKFFGKSSLRFYKITPQQVYVLDPEDPVGKRVQVELRS